MLYIIRNSTQFEVRKHRNYKRKTKSFKIVCVECVHEYVETKTNKKKCVLSIIMKRSLFIFSYNLF